jgi:hypothetical protein
MRKNFKLNDDDEIYASFLGLRSITGNAYVLHSEVTSSIGSAYILLLEVTSRTENAYVLDW